MKKEIPSNNLQPPPTVSLTMRQSSYPLIALDTPPRDWQGLAIRKKSYPDSAQRDKSVKPAPRSDTNADTAAETR
jgi:hypothetical protein